MLKSSKKLHILIIPSWYPNSKGDFNGSFFREQALALKKMDHKVGVIFPQVKSLKNLSKIIKEPSGYQYFNDNGINTFKWHYIKTPKLHKLDRKKWVRLGLKLYSNYVEKYGTPDIIHVHSLIPAGFLACRISSEFNIPYVITEHSSAFARNLINEHDINKLFTVVKKSSYNIAVSKKFAELLEDRFSNSQWHYLPNIVNNSFIEHEIKIPTKDFIILSISNLTANKSIDNLIRAFKDVNNQLPHIQLHIGGDGPEHDNLVSLVQELNLENNVFFLGKLSRDNVKNSIANCSIFVVSSKYETFSVVTIEALALGRPVIATKCGGPESIINQEVGLLVNVDDTMDLAEAILETYYNFNKYNTENIREYCKNNFSEQAVTSKLSKIYSSIISDISNE